MELINKIFSLFWKKSESKKKNNEKELIRDFLPKENKINKEKVSIKELVEEKNTKAFYAIDLETTGLSVAKDRIIEIGIVKFLNGHITDQFNTFVNPGFSIPKEASKVNNITDKMVRNSPSEKDAINNMMRFLENTSNGKILLCAHNADFDINFLTKALYRQGVSVSFTYVDTLKESKMLIPKLKNYKLGTVANYFNIVNTKAHRANEDATVSGLILNNLIKLYVKDNEKKIRTQQEYKEKTIPKEEELKICANIFHTITSVEEDLSLLRFYRNSSNYVSVDFLYSMFKFKFTRKGRYMILPKEEALSSGLPIEKATMSEGGSEYLRAFFNAPADLNRIKDFIIKSYRKCRKEFLSYKEYAEGTKFFEDNLIEYKKYGIRLNKDEAHLLLEESKDIPSIFELDIDKKNIVDIDTSNLEINPIHNRVPLTKIQNADNWDKGFDLGYPLWEKGDILRKENKLHEAIALFDEARYSGYNAPALYWSYAMAYRKLKDYENEIAILEEGIDRLFSDKRSDAYSKFEGRRQKALELLAKKKN